MRWLILQNKNADPWVFELIHWQARLAGHTLVKWTEQVRPNIDYDGIIAIPECGYELNDIIEEADSGSLSDWNDKFWIGRGIYEGLANSQVEQKYLVCYKDTETYEGDEDEDDDHFANWKYNNTRLAVVGEMPQTGNDFESWAMISRIKELHGLGHIFKNVHSSQSFRPSSGSDDLLMLS